MRKLREKQQVAVDDRLGDVDEFVAVVLRVVAQHLERSVGVDRVAGHEDPFRLLDRCPAPERALQAVVLGEALQGDVDRALQLLRAAVDDVGEDAALGGLVDVGGVLGREQRDHRAGGLADDLRDQLERVLGVQAEPNQCDVGALSGGHRPDLLHVDLAGDHLVPEPGHDLGKQLEPLPPLIRDQDTQVLDLCPRHPQPNLARTGCRRESARAPLRPLGGLVFPGRFAGPFDSWAAQSRRDVLKTAGGRKVARGFKSHPRRSTHFEKPWTERSRFWRWPVSKVRPISPSTGD